MVQNSQQGSQCCLSMGVLSAFFPSLSPTSWYSVRKERFSILLLGNPWLNSLWFWLWRDTEVVRKCSCALLLSCSISYAEKVPEKQFIPSPAHSVSHQSWQEPQLEPIQVWLAKPRGEEVVDVSTGNKPSFKLLIHCGSCAFLPWSVNLALWEINTWTNSGGKGLGASVDTGR